MTVRIDEIQPGDFCRVYFGLKGKKRLIQCVVAEIHGPVIRVKGDHRSRMEPVMRCDILTAWRTGKKQ